MLRVTEKTRPDEHVFTTALGILSEVPGSQVYISATTYAVTNRGRRFIRPSKEQVMVPRAIRTKLIPIGDNLIRLKACFATSHVSEDEIGVSESARPEWFGALDNTSIDVSDLARLHRNESKC
jgi:hypothetical protein